jgi:hypothetical protein
MICPYGIGKHPYIIDEKTFLQANHIGKQHPIHGVLKLKNQEELSLKIFMKDMKNESLFTGYFNKKLKIHYYKSRGTGTKVNINANKLNNQFASSLSSFEFDANLNEKLYDILHNKLTAQLENNKVGETANKKNLRTQ